MKKFAGFTPQQQYTLLSKQGYTGPADEASMAKFLAASPAAASKMGEYAQIAQQRLAGKPLPTQAMAEGGYVVKPAVSFGKNVGWTILDSSGGNLRTFSTEEEANSVFKALNEGSLTEKQLLQDRTLIPSSTAAPTQTPNTPDQVTGQPVVDTPTNQFPTQAQLAPTPSNTTPVTTAPEGQSIQEQAAYNPTSVATSANVAQVMPSEAQYVDPTVAQTGPAALAGVSQVAETAEAAAPVMTPASVMQATTIGEEVPQATAVQGEVSDKALIDAQQGKVSPEAMAEAATFDPKFMDKVSSGELQVSDKELVTPAGQQAEAVRTEVAQSQGVADVIAEQGTVQPEELPEPAQIAEEDMAQAQAITAEGLAPDATVVAARLEKFTVDSETLAQAMQGEVNALDTVQGQLTELMRSFDDGQTPAWASGAIRAANAAMAARGLGGSSMAGAAIFQAAMESALPIAAQDAQVFQQMNLTNLNNRQQVALANAAAQQGLQLQNLNNEQQAALQNSANAFSLQSQNLSNMQQTMLANAQIKAALQGQNLNNRQQSNLATAARYAEAANINLNNRQQSALQNNANALSTELANLNNKQQSYIVNAQLEAALQGKQIDNQQQAAIANAARFADAANISFTADQQAKLHNSELMKTIGLAELSTKQAATLQNAANLANMDMANLNNRQQAAVQNAQAFLQMDMTNLSNAQQTSIFNTQAVINAMFSDQAAENAAKQFNAASENQTNQFFSELASTTSRFNAQQKNAIAQFNSGEENAAEQFNANMQNIREQFNSTNSLIIAQANAQWRQNIDLTNTAAQNQANMDAAKAANNLTQTTLDQVWQRERDIMSATITTYEGDANRALSLMLGDKEAKALLDIQKSKDTASRWQAGINLADDLGVIDEIKSWFKWG